MKKILRIVLVVVVLGGIGWTFYYLSQKSKKKEVEYETELPDYRTITKKTVATGAVTPRKEIEIKPRVSGIIDKIYVEAGNKVKEGDVIALIKIIPNMLSLNNAKNRVNRAKISLENAKKEYERNNVLKQKGIISKSNWDAVELTFRNAEEELKGASENLQLIKKGSLKKNGGVSNTVVRSTISGMVLEVPVEEGNSVIESNTFNSGTTVAIVADMTDMIFKGKVDESEVGKIKNGMEIILKIGAIDKEEYVAKLEYISPKGKEEDGAIKFEIKAALVLKSGRFVRAGYSANADIVLDRKENVLSINENLISFRNNNVDSPYVELEKNPEEYEEIDLKLGISDGIHVEVLEGLEKSSKLKQPNTNLEASNTSKHKAQ